jgi:hypothetical protein
MRHVKPGQKVGERMRNIIGVIVCVAVVLIFNGCGDSKPPGPDHMEREKNVSEEHSLFTSSDYKVLTSLEGKVLTKAVAKADKVDFLNSINGASYVGKPGNLLVVEPNRIIQYPFSEIVKTENEVQGITFSYFTLLSELSSNLRLSSIEGEGGSNGVVLIDDTNRILVVLVPEGDGLKVAKAVTFNTDFPIQRVNLIGGYDHGGIVQLILAYEETITMMEAQTLTAIETIHMGNWKTLSGYVDSNPLAGPGFHLFQVNNDGERIRKFNVSRNQVVYEFDRREFPIEGVILQIKQTTLPSIILLTKAGENYRIYETNATEQLNSHFFVKEQFDDGSSFGDIQDIWFHESEAGYFIVVFQEGDVPVKYMDLHANDWGEL